MLYQKKIRKLTDRCYSFEHFPWMSSGMPEEDIQNELEKSKKELEELQEEDKNIINQIYDFRLLIELSAYTRYLNASNIELENLREDRIKHLENYNKELNGSLDAVKKMLLK